MATLNYANRLSNIQNRKFDRELNESLMSKSFSSGQIPDDVKYLLESMRPIDQKYNEKTITAAERVQTHLNNGLELHFERAYRTQGSVKTNTNIKVHSDFDLLTIVDKYHYPEVFTGNAYVESDPNEDIKELRRQSTKILKSKYDEVDDTHEKCISIYNKSLGRKVDIVFGYWYNTEKYLESSDEYYRGIYFYKFPNGPKYNRADFPFAHIHQVNVKGDMTRDGLRRGIRLLKNLKADSEVEIESLKSFHITSIVHSMDESVLWYTPGAELGIAKAVSTQMQRIIDDPAYRKGIKSPNGTENSLEKDDLVSDIKKLKIDLDTLIEDASKDILKSYVTEKAIMTY
ncbi:hypothetical protein [Spirosoma sp. KUDC1026]|uniref:hypothetical protein n=1 Tax=Spirosoma sp. KUDC1026 TaxID=2745947 RepID=UPI00159BB6F2|nr:hypothetical protein [Spirosoma sp. KUDC1026]QKZ12859.1 hypothetical protein HU175_09540 [Spirosoma sp. KUDC1026]